MKCDQCDQEATVHEVTIRQGVKVERHLCQGCAEAAGIAPREGISPADVLKIAMEAANAGLGGVGALGAPPMGQPANPVVGGKKAAKATGCGGCGMTWDEFKAGGMLGCPRCYDDFESRLVPLIERAHEGASQHIGKAPTRQAAGDEEARTRALAAKVEERAQRVSALRRLLDEAIKGEQYERAAQLRDELKKLSEGAA